MPEIRRRADDSLDEIVGTGHLHLEQMDDDHWWLALDYGAGRVTVAFHSKRTIHAYAELEPDSSAAAVNQQASEPDESMDIGISTISPGESSGVREALARLVETLARIEKLAELHTPVYEGYPTTVLKSPGKCYAAMEAIGEAARSALALHSGEEI